MPDWTPGSSDIALMALLCVVPLLVVLVRDWSIIHRRAKPPGVQPGAVVWHWPELFVQDRPTPVKIRAARPAGTIPN